MTQDKIAALFSLSVGLVSSWLGGWDTLLKIFAFLLVADYLSGVLAAWHDRKVDSDVMFWGFVRKVFIVGIIALAVLFDQMINMHIFRMIALAFFTSREGFSVIENTGKLGVKWPLAMMAVFTQLQQKGESVPITSLDAQPATDLNKHA